MNERQIHMYATTEEEGHLALRGGELILLVDCTKDCLAEKKRHQDERDESCESLDTSPFSMMLVLLQVANVYCIASASYYAHPHRPATS